MAPIKTIEDLIKRLKILQNVKPNKNYEYYQFSLFADTKDNISHSFVSEFQGFANRKKRIEKRAPAIIIPENIISFFKSIEIPLFVINNAKDFFFYLLVIGGHAIIEKSLVQRYLKNIFRPSNSIFSFHKGFINMNSIPKDKFNKAPTPKLRMKVLKRDKYRCSICGANTQSNVHVELHTHHIIPHSKGGLTEEDNLLTLCHTCHKGLEPHCDYSLLSFIKEPEEKNDIFDNQPYTEKLKQNLIAFKKFREKYFLCIKSKQQVGKQ